MVRDGVVLRVSTENAEHRLRNSVHNLFNAESGLRPPAMLSRQNAYGAGKSVSGL
jgi:hypothetical protein